MNSTRKKDSDFEIRRIFIDNEANELRFLQANASEFNNHYPNHSRWLEKSINEIINGKKVSFGVYKAKIDLNSEPKIELVGSVILKKGLYTDVVEVKNLFIKTSVRGHGYGTELCNVAEHYCRKRGYSIIKTEVPANEFKTINFLLSRDYRILMTKESGYKRGEYLYEMYKSIVPLYGGDYFDLYELSLWLIKHVYGFSNIIANKKDNTISFDLDPKVQINISAKNIVPRGIVIVLDDKNVDLESINKKIEYNGNHNLVFLFGRSFNSDVQNECKKRGTLLFDETLLYESFGDLFAYKPAKFEKEEIAGIIVLINPKFFKRTKTQTNFTYFKGDSIGKYLAKGNKVLFFSEPTSQYPDGGIRGYGDVVDVFPGKPEIVWDKFVDRNPLFKHEEYQIYTQNEGEIILGIEIKNFKEIEPISFHDLKKIVGVDVDIEDLGHYYISNGMLNKFYENKKDIKPDDVDFSPGAPKVFISSTFNDLKVEREDLKKAIKHDLRYHVYAFESGGSGFPAREHILEKLNDSDIYICIIGKTYGYEFEVDGNRISATEDEYNHARKWKIPIFVYVKNVPTREEKTIEFLNKIGDYMKGSLWQKFETTEELINYVKKDVGEQWAKRK
jgi:GNAT superfamily N-acetyltransferase